MRELALTLSQSFGKISHLSQGGLSGRLNAQEGLRPTYFIVMTLQQNYLLSVIAMIDKNKY